MKLSEAKEIFKDEWLAFQINEDGEDPEGEVLLHEADGDYFDARLVAERITSVYITYAGEPMAAGYIAMF